MAETLILDAEALSALAFASERGVSAARARSVLQLAYERRALVRVPSVVLAEVCRGTARDAAVTRVLNGRGIEVVDVTGAMARRAGGLLHRAGLGSAHAVDAFVIATALSFGRAVVATHDPDDLARLAAGEAGITLLAI